MIYKKLKTYSKHEDRFAVLFCETLKQISFMLMLMVFLGVILNVWQCTCARCCLVKRVSELFLSFHYYALWLVGELCPAYISFHGFVAFWAGALNHNGWSLKIGHARDRILFLRSQA